MHITTDLKAYWVTHFTYICSNVESMWSIVVVQWDIHMQYGRHICSGAYVNNLKCMYSSAFGDILDCIEFI